MKRSANILFLAVLFVGLVSSFVRGAVTLPAVIDDHMVLQRDQPVPIWGKAAPGERVTVRFAGTASHATADQNGRWQVRLPKLVGSSQPRSMRIEGSSGSKIELTDILVGEVWFSTGPSNIHWAVKKCDNAEQEIREADFPRIRFFTVERKAADEPQDDCVGEWFGCSPDTVGDVSGVGYFFSRRLHRDLDVPVGLLQSYWGGSRVEAWTSREALAAEPAVRPILDWWEKELSGSGSSTLKNPHSSHHRPACLYNGMVAPLVPFSIRGVICYQGLGNLFWADHSANLLETMVGDWRTRWAQGDFSVGMVQPAPFDCAKWAKSGPDAYAVQREAQLIVRDNVPNIGIALTMDVDAVDVLHFTNKQLVGHRLSNWALATVYGFEQAYRGPMVESISIEGAKLRVHFQHTGMGLTTNDGKPPRHFELAGTDGVFHPASAQIEGADVILHSNHVTAPVAARFAFTETAVVNLTNSDGLPASLFRGTGILPVKEVQ